MWCNTRRGAIVAGMPVGSIRPITTAIVALVTVIAVVSAPVVIASTFAAASAPTICIGTYTNFKIKVAGHVTKHIAPHIIEKVEVIVPAIIATPAVTMVIVPWHIECHSG
jgi:hypothetical protein